MEGRLDAIRDPRTDADPLRPFLADVSSVELAGPRPLSLWAHVPYYVREPPSPKATLAIVQEFVRHYYGPAADEILRYLELAQAQVRDRLYKAALDLFRRRRCE